MILPLLESLEKDSSDSGDACGRGKHSHTLSMQAQGNTETYCEAYSLLATSTFKGCPTCDAPLPW